MTDEQFDQIMIALRNIGSGILFLWVCGIIGCFK